MSGQRALETSPRGIAKWIKINAPDTQYKEEGEYSVTLLLKSGSPAAEAFQKRIDQAVAVVIAAAKTNPENSKVKGIKCEFLPYKDDTDKDGNPTGFVRFQFKAKASGKKKDGTPWTFKPKAFDSLGQPIDLEKVNVWGGSEVKVSYEIRTYGETGKYNARMSCGVTLALAAVQIIKLVTGKGKDAQAFGFGVEEVGEDSSTGTENQAPNTNEEF